MFCESVNIMVNLNVSQLKIKLGGERVQVPYSQTMFAGSQHRQASFKTKQLCEPVNKNQSGDPMFGA